MIDDDVDAIIATTIRFFYSESCNKFASPRHMNNAKKSFIEMVLERDVTSKKEVKMLYLTAIAIAKKKGIL